MSTHVTPLHDVGDGAPYGVSRNGDEGSLQAETSRLIIDTASYSRVYFYMANDRMIEFAHCSPST